MDRKKTILNFINDEYYVPMKLKDIAAILCIPKQDINELENILDVLTNEGKIIKTSKPIS